MMRESRRSQRLMAFQVLYSQEFQSCSSLEELKRAFMSVPWFVSELDGGGDEDVMEFRRVFLSASGDETAGAAGKTEPCGFGWELVSGIWLKRDELDSVIAQFAKNWRLDRLGRAELNILRMGTYEMLYRDDIPPRVTINEALELDKQFGDPRSSSFVNGILDAVCKAMEKHEIARRD